MTLPIIIRPSPIDYSSLTTSDSLNNPISINNLISCCYFNVRSLVNKVSKFQSLIYSFNYDIVFVTETWLTDFIFDQEILPTNYCIFRKDRHSRGGGVMIAVRDTISATAVNVPTVPATNSLEVISLNLMLPPFAVSTALLVLTMFK